MAIGAMGAVNLVSSLVGTAGNASGGASASSGQGGAGLGYNILGAPGDPGGVAYKMLIDAKARKEDKRRFEVSSGLIKAQTEQLNLENDETKRKREWEGNLRRLLYGGRR